MTFEIDVEQMDCHLFKGMDDLNNWKDEGLHGPRALAVSGEWALSTGLTGLVHAYVHAKFNLSYV